MQNFFKAIFFLFLFLLVLYAGVLFVFNSSSLTAKIAHRALKNCSEFNIRNVDYSLSGVWVWDNVTFQCTVEEDVYTGEIREMELAEVSQIIFAQKPVHLKAEGVSVKSKNVNVRELEFDIVWSRRDSWAGTMGIERIDLSDYKMTYITADILSDRVPRVDIKNIQGQFYDGQMSGEIFLECRDKFPYHMDISIKQANLDLLDDANASLFGSLHGFMDIQLSFRGDQSKVKKISGSFDLSRGASVKALLIKFLLDYLPKGSNQRALFQTLLEQEGYLSLDDAIFSFSSVQDDHLNGGLLIKSEELNLDADVTLDINIEGGMQNIFNLIEKIRQINLP